MDSDSLYKGRLILYDEDFKTNLTMFQFMFRKDVVIWVREM